MSKYKTRGKEEGGGGEGRRERKGRREGRREREGEVCVCGIRPNLAQISGVLLVSMFMLQW